MLFLFLFFFFFFFFYFNAAVVNGPNIFIPKVREKQAVSEYRV